jgi:hypothetical protein
MYSNANMANTALAGAYLAEEDRKRREQESIPRQDNLLDTVGKIALAAGATAGAVVAGKRLAGGQNTSATYDLSRFTPKKVSRAAAGVVAPQETVAPSRPAPTTSMERQRQAEQVVREAREERPQGVRQGTLPKAVGVTSPETGGYQVSDPWTAGDIASRSFRQQEPSQETYITPSRRQEVYAQVASKPESKLPRVYRPKGGLEDIVSDPEQANVLITDPSTGEIYMRGQSPSGFAERYLRESGYQEANTLVDQQTSKVLLNSDQAVNAVNSAEDQQTGRVKMAFQRNEDENLAAIEFAEDQVDAQLARMAQAAPETAGSIEVDAAINQVAAQRPDGMPLDQVEKLATTKTVGQRLASVGASMSGVPETWEGGTGIGLNLESLGFQDVPFSSPAAQRALERAGVTEQEAVNYWLGKLSSNPAAPRASQPVEGIDLRTGERFAIKQTPTETYPKSTLGSTGLVPGQKIAFEQAPESVASSSAARFMEAERNKISQELAEQGIAALPEDIDAELAKRISGSEAWTYGPKYTQRKQALQLGATLGGEPLENLKTSSVIIGGETIPVSSLKEPVYMEGTAEKLLERANRKRDWLGSVRLKQQQDQIRLDKVNQQINDLTNYKTEITNFLASGRATPEQARAGRQRLSDVSLDLDRLSGVQSELSNVAYNSAKGLAGAERHTSSALQEMTVPSKLASGVEEGFVVRPKRTAPDTMSFEAEGGELSNLERGRPANILSSEELEIVPGGLLSGGRAKSVANIGQEAIDPDTGELLLVPLVDPDTGERIVQKLAGKRMGEDVSVRGRGGVAGLDTMSSIGIYGIERGQYGTAAQTKAGEYTREASQVPSLVNPQLVQKRTGGYFNYPQQREAAPQKYQQEITPERIASVQMSQDVLQGRTSIPRVQAPMQSARSSERMLKPINVEEGVYGTRPYGGGQPVVIADLATVPDREAPVTSRQLSFAPDVVPAVVPARTTAADVAAQQLEAYMAGLQRGRTTPLTSEVVIQPQLLSPPGTTQMFLPLEAGQRGVTQAGTISPAQIKPIRAQAERQVAPVVFQPDLLSLQRTPKGKLVSRGGILY